NRSRLQNDPVHLSLRLNDRQTQSVERLPMVGFERLMADLAAVVHTREHTFTAQLKLDEVIRVRHNGPILVYDLDRHKGEIAAVGFDDLPIRNQNDPRWLRDGSHFTGQHNLAILARYCSEGSRFERHSSHD